eukprot:scaffold1228_cov246-Pinguiococcus_pyrenoidosus.AAC.16
MITRRGGTKRGRRQQVPGLLEGVSAGGVEIAAADAVADLVFALLFGRRPVSGVALDRDVLGLETGQISNGSPLPGVDNVQRTPSNDVM